MAQDPLGRSGLQPAHAARASVAGARRGQPPHPADRPGRRLDPRNRAATASPRPSSTWAAARASTRTASSTWATRAGASTSVLRPSSMRVRITKGVFVLADVETADYGEGYDLVCLIYGELNAFSPDVRPAHHRQGAPGAEAGRRVAAGGVARRGDPAARTGAALLVHDGVGSLLRQAAPGPDGVQRRRRLLVFVALCSRRRDRRRWTSTSPCTRRTRTTSTSSCYRASPRSPAIRR